DILVHPTQPYTRELVSSVPSIRPPARSPVDNNAILSIRGLTKTYGKKSLWGRATSVHALSDINLDVHRDEVVGIVGESGSGKSTLARCVIGLVDGWQGDVKLHGNALASSSRERPYDIK